MPLRDYSTVEVTVTERRRLERPLLVLIWLGVVAFSVGEGNPFYALMATLAVGVNFVAAHRRMEVYLRRGIINAAVAAAGLILIVEVVVAGQLIIIALGHFLILLQLTKLFERKSNRDYFQMLALSLLLVVAGALLSDRLLYAIIFLTYLALACYVVMVFTLKRGLDAAAAARLAMEQAPLAPRRVAWNVGKTWPRGALLGRSAWVLFIVLLIGAGTFLAAPRVGAGGGALAREGGAAATGFATGIRLGESSRVYESNRVVMQVRARRADTGRMWTGPMYFRGQTYNTYRESRWFKGRRERGSTFVPPLPDGALDAAIVQEITMDRHLAPSAFALPPVVAGQSADATLRVEPDGDVAILHTRSDASRIRYTAFSWARPLSDEQREYLRLRRSAVRHEYPRPQVAGRVTALARRWCADLLTARETAPPARRGEYDLRIARHLADRLRSEYTYSLDLSGHDASAEGVEEFLFEEPSGHCEYFASAHVVLCRLLDVRARLATGFMTDEYSNALDAWIVRDRHAHAWTEVYTPETWWATFDATPAGSSSAPGGWWRQLEDTWSSMRFFWQDYFVGYNAAARRRLGEQITGALGAVAGAARGAWNAVRNSFGRLLIEGRIDELALKLLIAVAVAGLLVEALVIVRLQRRRHRREQEALRTYGVRPAELKFFDRLLRLLARHGVRRDPGQTYREYASEATARLELPPGDLSSVVELYYRLRWASRPVEPEALDAGRRAVDRIARRLAGRSAD